MYPELQDLDLLANHWVAIDAREGGRPVVVDWDREIDELCRRIADTERTSLTIVFCGAGRA